MSLWLGQAWCAQIPFAQQPSHFTIDFYTMPSLGSWRQDLTVSKYCRRGFSRNKDTKVLWDSVTFVFHCTFWNICFIVFHCIFSSVLETPLLFSQMQQWWLSVACDGQIQSSFPSQLFQVIIALYILFQQRIDLTAKCHWSFPNSMFKFPLFLTLFYTFSNYCLSLCL